MPVYSRPPGQQHQPQASQPLYSQWNNSPAPAASQHSSPMYGNAHQPFYPPSSGQPASQNLPYPGGSTPWTPTPNPSSQPSQVSQDAIKASMVSAVEDMLKRKFREDAEQLSTELLSLRQTNSELESGKKRIESILKNIETEKADVQTRTQAIEDRRKEIETALAKLKTTQLPPIDDIVTAPYPLYRQLFEAHAEELAIDDAIYLLGEALGKNRLSVEIYLRKVRELSAQQYKMRALMDKCRNVAGLPAVTSDSCNAH